MPRRLPLRKSRNMSEREKKGEGGREGGRKERDKGCREGCVTMVLPGAVTQRVKSPSRGAIEGT